MWPKGAVALQLRLAEEVKETSGQENTFQNGFSKLFQESECVLLRLCCCFLKPP